MFIFKVCVKMFNKSGVLNLTQRKEIFPSLSFKKLFKMNVVIRKVREINNFSKNYRSTSNVVMESYRMIGKTEGAVYWWSFIPLSPWFQPFCLVLYSRISLEPFKFKDLGFWIRGFWNVRVLRVIECDWGLEVCLILILD